jgi:hypothetical protein
LRQFQWGKVLGLAQLAGEGLFWPAKVAEVTRTTSEEIARSAGRGKDLIQRKDRFSLPT